MSVELLNVPSTLTKKILTGPLRLVTLCSDDIDEIRSFYVDQMGLTVEGPLEIEDPEKLKTYYGITEGIEMSVYQVGPKYADDGIFFRIINISQSTPKIKASASAREVGLLLMERQSGPELQVAQSPSHYYWRNIVTTLPKGSEIPDEVVAIPTVTFVTDQIEEDIIFYTHIFGMNLLSDETREVAKAELPGLERHATIRSIRLQSKTGEGCYMRLIAFEDEEYAELQAAPRLPNQGIPMCSYETTDIGEILARAHAKQIKIYRTPRKHHDPILGEVITMSLLSPTGSIIEVYSRA